MKLLSETKCPTNRTRLLTYSLWGYQEVEILELEHTHSFDIQFNYLTIIVVNTEMMKKMIKRNLQIALKRGKRGFVTKKVTSPIFLF